MFSDIFEKSGSGSGSGAKGAGKSGKGQGKGVKKEDSKVNSIEPGKTETPVTSSSAEANGDGGHKHKQELKRETSVKPKGKKAKKIDVEADILGDMLSSQGVSAKAKVETTQFDSAEIVGQKRARNEGEAERENGGGNDANLAEVLSMIAAGGDRGADSGKSGKKKKRKVKA